MDGKDQANKGRFEQVRLGSGLRAHVLIRVPGGELRRRSRWLAAVAIVGPMLTAAAGQMRWLAAIGVLLAVYPVWRRTAPRVPIDGFTATGQVLRREGDLGIEVGTWRPTKAELAGDLAPQIEAALAAVGTHLPHGTVMARDLADAIGAVAGPLPALLEYPVEYDRSVVAIARIAIDQNYPLPPLAY